MGRCLLLVVIAVAPLPLGRRLLTEPLTPPPVCTSP
jgi:hypothetical protein